MSDSKKLPSTKPEWRRRARVKNLGNPTIHTASLFSASSIEEEQFLSLHILWQEHDDFGRFAWRKFGLSRWKAKAENILSSYSSWRSYCDLWTKDPDNIPESTFALVRYYQLLAIETTDEVLTPSVAFPPVAKRTRSKVPTLERSFSHMQFSTPTKSTGIPLDYSDSEEETGDSPPTISSPGPVEIQNLMYPPTKDEQIVNTALVSFLTALILHSQSANRWTLHRKSFKADFSHASFEARTDGYLEDKKSDGKVRALIEVKAVLRHKKRKQICMQESAQMAAWILSHPDRDGSLNLPGRRLHVSQDRHEIYIVIAEYTDDYIRYLEQSSTSESAPTESPWASTAANPPPNNPTTSTSWAKHVTKQAYEHLCWALCSL